MSRVCIKCGSTKVKSPPRPSRPNRVEYRCSSCDNARHRAHTKANPGCHRTRCQKDRKNELRRLHRAAARPFSMPLPVLTPPERITKRLTCGHPMVKVMVSGTERYGCPTCGINMPRSWMEPCGKCGGPKVRAPNGDPRCTACTRSKSKANYAKNPGPTKASSRRHRARPEIRRASNAVRKGIRDGTIVKTPCVVCGATKVDAHHAWGYAPENAARVVFLCRRHHARADHYPEFNAEVIRLAESMLREDAPEGRPNDLPLN